MKIVLREAKDAETILFGRVVVTPAVPEVSVSSDDRAIDPEFARHLFSHVTWSIRDDKATFRWSGPRSRCPSCGADPAKPSIAILLSLALLGVTVEP